MSVAEKKRVEVEPGEAAQGRAERRFVVDDHVGEERAFAGRLPDARVSDDEDVALRPVQGDLPGRLAVRVYDGERPHPRSVRKVGVDGCSALARELGVRGMDRDRSSRALLHLGSRAEMVAVREDDASNPLAGEVREDVLVHLDRIDADVPARAFDEVAVEVVAVALTEPRPGEDPWQDLAHGPESRTARGGRLRPGGLLLLRHPVHLDVDVLAVETATQEDALPVLDHHGMTAQVHGGLPRIESGRVEVLAHHVLGAAHLALPPRVLPRPAHQGDVPEPPAGLLLRGFQFLLVTELVRAARRLQHDQAHSGRGFLAQRSDDAHDRRDAGHRGDEEVVLVLVRAIELEGALRAVPKQHAIARPERVQPRRELPLRDPPREEIQLALRRGGDHRVGALDDLAAVFDAERRVLSGLEAHRTVGRDTHGPEVGTVVLAPGNPAALVLVGARHAASRCDGHPTRTVGAGAAARHTAVVHRRAWPRFSKARIAARRSRRRSITTRPDGPGRSRSFPPSPSPPPATSRSRTARGSPNPASPSLPTRTSPTSTRPAEIWWR